VSGFLNFARFERVGHAAEDMLSRLRDGELLLNAEITSALLASVDAVRQMLSAVEASGTDGDVDYTDLIARLAEVTKGGGGKQAEAAPEVVSPKEEIEPAPQAEAAPKKAAATPKPRKSKKSESPETVGEATRESVEPLNATPASPAPVLTSHPASPAAREEHPADSAAHGATDSVIRVNVNLLDKLMNLVGELVLVRNQILQFSTGHQESAFLGASQRLNLITTELQEGIMKTRMQPIGTIWNKFPRIVRDLALACGKQVRIEMEGEDTELDKTLIEAIRDPLTHIVRNAIDHGIEMPSDRAAAGRSAEGKLLLRAFHESGQVIIEVGEDGAGIDLERVRNKALERGIISADQSARMNEAESLKLIFLPGFSTAQKVTNNSGRGVGMDVVRTNIEKIGGTVDIRSRRGEGTTLRIKIPLTLAIIPALIVTCAGDRYAIPQVSLIELVRVDADDKARRIETVQGAAVYRLRGNLLPLVYLRKVLQLSGEKDGEVKDAAHIVVLQIADQQFGLVVDEVNDTEEIVVKPLGKQLKGSAGFAGATIMGDGRVALILDVLGIAQLASVASESRDSQHGDAHHGTAARLSSKRQSLLLCRAGSAERIAVPLALVSRLEEFHRASIEHAAGSSVVRYRDEILPLVELGALVDAGGSSIDGENDPIQVVVFSDGHHRVGVVVDRILDIVEEEACATQLSSRPGLLGSALVGGKATDFLDLRAVFEAAKQAWYDSESVSDLRHGAILLVDQSPFTRCLVRSYLEIAGHHVYEATAANEAMDRLEHSQVDLVIASAELPGNGEVLAQLRKHTDEAHIRIIGVGDERGEPSPESAQKYDAFHFKSDRKSILKSVEKLIANVSHPGNTASHELDRLSH
jgi:two-component system, chemotaxis family, sensor kinase CheA